MKQVPIIIFLIFMLSCVFDGVNPPPTVTTTSGVTGPSITITSLQAIGDKLIINGNNLSSVSGVAISGTGINKPFEVTSASDNQLVSINLNELEIPVGLMLELILSSAQGSTSFPITFTLQPDAVKTVNIKDGQLTPTKFKGVTTTPAFGTVPQWVSDGSGGGYFLFGPMTGGGGGGGSVTSVIEGEGIFAQPNPIVSAGTISVDKGTRGDPTFTKIPYFNHTNQIEISDPGRIYFSTTNGTDNNFSVLNNQSIFTIGKESSISTGTITSYLKIDPTGKVDIPIFLDVGPAGGNGSLMVGGKTVCLSDGSNCPGAATFGDVKGPATSTAGGVPSFADTSGKILSNNTKLVADLVTGPSSASATDLAQLDATGKIISDSGILAANVPTMQNAATAANSPILSSGSTKILFAAPYTFPNTVCGNNLILKSNGTNYICMPDLSGTGNVVGPSTPTSGNLASYNGNTGTLIQDSGLATNNIVTMLIPPLPASNQLIISSGGGSRNVQSSTLSINELVTMAATPTAADFVLTSAGANTSAKASNILSSNVMTMTNNALLMGEVLVSDGVNKMAKDSGVAIDNIPQMATNSTGANRPILAVTTSRALYSAPYSFPATTCANNEILKYNSAGTGFICGTVISADPTIGDVVGPASAVDTAIAKFNGTTGKLIQNSGVLISAANGITGVGAFTSTGNMTVDTNTLFVDATNHRVGIGTITPTSQLTTTSNASIGGALAVGTSLTVTTTSTLTGNTTVGGTLGVTGNAAFDTNVLFVDAANNKVGILTATPATPLDVVGAAQISGSLKIGTWTVANTAPTTGQVLKATSATTASWGTDTSGLGTSTTNAVAKYSNTTGSLADSGVFIDGTNNVTGIVNLTSSSGTITGATALTLQNNAAPTLNLLSTVNNNAIMGTINFQESGATYGYGILYDGTGAADRLIFRNQTAAATFADRIYFPVVGTSVLQAQGDVSVTGGLTVDTDSLIVDSTNNRVGMGTAAPSSTLEVVGKAHVGSAYGTQQGTSKLSIRGASSSNTAGPWVNFYNSSDDYPHLQILPWANNDTYLNFDTFFDTTWKSSVGNTTNSFRMHKVSTAFNFDFGSLVAAGALPAFTTVMSLTPSSVSVAGSVSATGQISSGASTQTTAAVDWDNGNIISTSYDCALGNISFVNLKIGGTYTLIDTSTTTNTCVFDTATTGTNAATVTYRFRPANTTRVANTHTIYTLMRVGTTVYVSWGSNF